MAAFLNGGVDTKRIADLVLPLSFVRHWWRSQTEQASKQPAPFDLSAALCRDETDAAARQVRLPGVG